MKSIIILIAVPILILGGLFMIATLRSDGSDSKLADSSNTENGYDVGSINNQVDNGQAILLDVRSTVEYDLNHAIGSTNYDVELLKTGNLPDIDKDQKIYLYCRSGNRSAEAAAIMSAAGYTNLVDLGGLNEWIDAGGEIEQTQLEGYLEILNDLGKKPIEPLGPADADLIIVKYSDFSCPFCARYNTETEPSILKDYVNNPDKKVRYEFRNLAYLGDESALAAVGGYCANEQNLFWPYHDAITVSFNGSGSSFYTPLNLTLTVEQLGGDKEGFKACLDSGVYNSVVSAETMEGQSAGINSTPTVLVGDQVVNGAVPYSVYKATIDAEL